MSGWLALWRKFEGNELWQEPRVYSRAEAWLYILMKANWEDTVKMDGTVIERGSFETTIRRLSADWRWSKSRVERFLRELQFGTQIGTAAGHASTVIRVTNYEQYQSVAGRGRTPAGRSRLKNRDTNEDTYKQENKNIPPSPSGSPPSEFLDEPKVYAPKISLTKREIKSLVDEFGRDSVKYYIPVCSDYLVGNGKTKKSSVAFLRNWIRKEIAHKWGFYAATGGAAASVNMSNHPSRKVFKAERKGAE